jgi:hypothetical protein
MKYPKPGDKKKPGKTAEEKAYLNRVASLGCIICGKPANVHHIRISGEPRDHKKTIPLCYDHHQGKEGIHFLGKHVWRKKYGHELDYLKRVMVLVNY